MAPTQQRKQESLRASLETSFDLRSSQLNDYQVSRLWLGCNLSAKASTLHMHYTSQRCCIMTRLLCVFSELPEQWQPQ